MSKITKALEKAARERLRRQQMEAAVMPASEANSAEGPAPRLAVQAVAGKSRETESVPAKPAATHRRGVVEPIRFNPDLHIDPHIIVAADPKSPISEQYRIVRTNLQSMKPLTNAKVLLVTSSVHGEGKSVSSLNLAISLAQQQGMKVLLIDADLRASTMDWWLGIKLERGLSTALAEEGSLDGLLVNLVEDKLWILPAGPQPHHPAELLDSTNMKRIIESARMQFDVVVIDSPPVLPVADPGILGRLVDGVILIVRSGKTQRGTVEKTKALLNQTKAKIIGCLLTHAEFSAAGYYGYGYGYYRYGSNGNGKNDSNGQASPKETSGLKTESSQKREPALQPVR